MLWILIPLGWFFTGLATVATVIYSNRKAFRCPVFTNQLCEFKTSFGVLGGPITVFVVGTVWIIQLADRAGGRKEVQIAALRRELADAHKELEHYITSGKSS